MDRKNNEGIARLVLFPTGLARPFYPSNEFRRGDAQGVRYTKEGVERRRLLVVFKLAYVGAVKVRLEGHLFLRQSRMFSGILQHFPKHVGRLSRRPDNVCGL
jgi:hypothetical protein